jgi:hypothetical protein
MFLFPSGSRAAAKENSPAIYRWVTTNQNRSPTGTTEVPIPQSIIYEYELPDTTIDCLPKVISELVGQTCGFANETRQGFALFGNYF